MSSLAHKRLCWQFVFGLLVLLCAMLGPVGLQAQVIDTGLDYAITNDDTANAFIRTRFGFEVAIYNPSFVATKRSKLSKEERREMRDAKKKKTAKTTAKAGKKKKKKVKLFKEKKRKKGPKGKPAGLKSKKNKKGSKPAAKPGETKPAAKPTGKPGAERMGVLRDTSANAPPPPGPKAKFREDTSFKKVSRGKLLKAGSDKWYVHIIQSHNVKINGGLVTHDGITLIIPIVSDQRKLRLDSLCQAPPDSMGKRFMSRAQVFKAFVFHGDSHRVFVNKVVKKRLNNVKAQIKRYDPFAKKDIPKIRMIWADISPDLDRWMTINTKKTGINPNIKSISRNRKDLITTDQKLKLDTLHRLHLNKKILEDYIQLHREYRRYRAAANLPKFFASKNFDNTLKYSIVNAPYALPKWVSKPKPQKIKPKKKANPSQSFRYKIKCARYKQQQMQSK